MIFKIQSLTIKQGAVVSVVGPGKYFKLLFASGTVGSVLVNATFSGGNNINLVAGRGAEFDTAQTQVTLSTPGATTDVYIQFYFGNYPYTENPKTEPGSSFLTTDWVTIVSGAFPTFLGRILFNGTVYRRKSFTVINMTGSGISGVNPANVGTLQGSIVNTGTNSYVSWINKQSSGFNSGFVPLLPCTSTGFAPVTIESDDLFTIGSAGNTVDFSIIQIWEPTPFAS